MKRPLVIKNARIVTPYRLIEGDIFVSENGKIGKVDRLGSTFPAGAMVLDVDFSHVAPGFIDLHLHGAGGADFMDGTPEAFETAAKTHLSHGTTTMMPTTLSGPIQEIEKTLKAYRVAKDLPGMPNLIGVHLEGPYFAQAQRGAQDPRFIKNPDPREYIPLLDSFPEIRRWSLAPELPGALEMGMELMKRGVIAAIAHTDTDYDIVVQAVEQGFGLLTHMYSGMSGVFRRNAYRHAGVIEAGYLLDDLPVEVIADGKHLPIPLLRLIHKMKGVANICLVSDSLRATGLGEGEFLLGAHGSGQRVIVEDGVAKLPDRTAFAGSVATAERLVRTMCVDVGIPLTDAVRMMTVNPARVVGLQARKGKIAAGFDADLVVFDSNFVVEHVMVAGNLAAI